MSEADPGDRFIFVGGPPRSGTTLVQNILDCHPRICGAPEFLHLRDIVLLRRELHHSHDRGWIDEFCSKADVDRWVRGLVEEFFLTVARKYNKELLSEKSPSNVLVFPELAELFPAARFICVIRDPRAIVASLLRVGARGAEKGWQMQKFTRRLSSAIEHVEECFESAFAVSNAMPDKVINVVYERLVTDPDGEAKRLCDFLGIEWSDRMLHPGSVSHPGEQAIVNDVWYDQNSYRRDPVPSEIEKWKDQLSTSQRVIIADAFRDNVELARFGYDFTANGFSVPERITAPVSAKLVSAWNGSEKRRRSVKRMIAKTIRMTSRGSN